jgi:hypothetical protein
MKEYGAADVFSFFHWLYSSLGPWPLIFSSMIILQTVGLLGRVISSSQGLYLNTEQHKHTINTYTHQTSMPSAGFEHTIPASERAKTVHALDCSATVTGSGCRDPYFLDLGPSWRWVVSFTPLPLYQRGQSPPYPLNRRLGGPQSGSGRCGENSCPHRDSNSDPSVVQSVANRYTDCAIPARNTWLYNAGI